jgi:hypothetical protein
MQLKDIESAEVQVSYLYLTGIHDELSAEKPYAYAEPVEISMFTRAYTYPHFEGDWEPMFELDLPYSKYNEKRMLEVAGHIEDLLVLALGEDQVESEVYQD